MLPAPFRVVLDACVLFPFSLRDTLLRAAEAGLYQLYWSEEILDEARRNLIEKKRTTEKQADKLFHAMRGAFPESMVTGHEPLVDAMPNDKDDRHVAAAAVKAGAQVIVTSNLRDFANLPTGIEAQSPDEFLCNLFDLDQELVIDLLRQQATDHKKVSTTFEQLLGGLEQWAPEFVTAVRRRLLSAGY